jgi:hypothetical protein
MSSPTIAIFMSGSPLDVSTTAKTPAAAVLFHSGMGPFHYFSRYAIPGAPYLPLLADVGLLTSPLRLALLAEAYAYRTITHSPPQSASTTAPQRAAQL